MSESVEMKMHIENEQLHWEVKAGSGGKMVWSMSLGEARSLFFGLGTQIAKLQQLGPDNPDSLFEQATMLDVISPTYQVGSDDEGRPVLALKVDPLPVFKYRFEDQQAATIAKTFSEIVNSPRDVRLAGKQ